MSNNFIQDLVGDIIAERKRATPLTDERKAELKDKVAELTNLQPKRRK